MKILITGTTQGIGKAIAEMFISEGHEVTGIDLKDSSIESERYRHIVCDIRNIDVLPTRSILNIGSASAHTGSEFPEYCASKGGVVAYTKNVALRVAEFGATCNSLDPGGVLTPLNDCVINDPELWAQIMEQTPLKKWATPFEIAQWVYFLTVVNTFCTGQSIVVDGGESINSKFVWK